MFGITLILGFIGKALGFIEVMGVFCHRIFYARFNLLFVFAPFFHIAYLCFDKKRICIVNLNNQ